MELKKKSATWEEKLADAERWIQESEHRKEIFNELQINVDVAEAQLESSEELFRFF